MELTASDCRRSGCRCGRSDRTSRRWARQKYTARQQPTTLRAIHGTIHLRSDSDSCVLLHMVQRHRHASCTHANERGGSAATGTRHSSLGRRDRGSVLTHSTNFHSLPLASLQQHLPCVHSRLAMLTHVAATMRQPPAGHPHRQRHQQHSKTDNHQREQCQFHSHQLVRIHSIPAITTTSTTRRTAAATRYRRRRTFHRKADVRHRAHWSGRPAAAPRTRIGCGARR